MRSKFPEEIDTHIELFDLPSNKVKQAERLTQLKMKSTEALSHEEEQELKSLTNELKEYMITPETWNKFGEALENTQRFFRDNVQGFIEEKQEEWAQYVDDFNYVGDWELGKEYKFQNLIRNPENGDLYMALKDHIADNTNRPLTNSTEFWVRSSRKGDKGDPGINSTFKGTWNSETSYSISDSVYFYVDKGYDGILYIAREDTNAGESPETHPNKWFLWKPIIVGTEKPNGLLKGVHLIQLDE